ncbi:MAG: elongation factor P, partial [Parcubacteria group bacterium Gr01-1014_33]
IGQKGQWLVSDTDVTAVFFNEKLLTFSLPIKMDIKVSEAPPGVQGGRSQGGTKAITLETGTVIQAPLFINSGDIVRVNTETGEYVERVEKA